MKHNKLIRALTLAACAGLSADLQAQAPQYNVTVLLKDASSDTARAFGLNNLGDVVGSWDNSAFLYTNGVMMNLGGAIGDGYASGANDINDSGQIVGWFSPNGVDPNIFLFSLAEGVKYITSNGQGSAVSAYAINNAGQMAGVLFDYSQQYAAVFFPNGSVVPLPISGQAVDINDNYGSHGLGQIVGDSFNDDPTTFNYAFLYTDGIFVNTDPSCQYVSHRESSSASAINNSGQVAAYCYVFVDYCECSSYQGYIYNATNEYTYPLGSDALGNDINDLGWIVGQASAKPDYPSYPYLWVNNMTNGSYTAYNLTALIATDTGITYLAPVAINNQGQIAANTNLGPVLLTPVTPPEAH